MLVPAFFIRDTPFRTTEFVMPIFLSERKSSKASCSFDSASYASALRSKHLPTTDLFGFSLRHRLVSATIFLCSYSCLWHMARLLRQPQTKSRTSSFLWSEALVSSKPMMLTACENHLMASSKWLSLKQLPPLALYGLAFSSSAASSELKGMVGMACGFGCGWGCGDAEAAFFLGGERVVLRLEFGERAARPGAGCGAGLADLDLLLLLVGSATGSSRPDDSESSSESFSEPIFGRSIGGGMRSAEGSATKEGRGAMSFETGPESSRGLCLRYCSIFGRRASTIFFASSKYDTWASMILTKHSSKIR
mmetsp:Transcript_5881/g.10793  ORF Transcript_5881/g.10793 Transcript_5881/m.10793 type:complete len:307 (+) Transcript_5881:741-1661(+)